MINIENKCYNEYPYSLIESKLVLEKTIGCPVMSCYDNICGIVSFNKKLQNTNIYNIIHSNSILQSFKKVINNKIRKCGYIGICYKKINDEKLLIISVEEKSPAYESKLQVGDLIFMINDKKIGHQKLLDIIYFSRYKDSLHLLIHRKEKYINIIVPIKQIEQTYYKDKYNTFDNTSDIIYC